jgi:hypothetical protein
MHDERYSYRVDVDIKFYLVVLLLQVTVHGASEQKAMRSRSRESRRRKEF